MKITALINLKTGPHTFIRVGILTESGDTKWLMIADTEGILQEQNYGDQEQMLDSVKRHRQLKTAENVRIQELP